MQPVAKIAKKEVAWQAVSAAIVLWAGTMAAQRVRSLFDDDLVGRGAPCWPVLRMLRVAY